MSIVSENIINSIAEEFKHQLDIRDYTYNSDVVRGIITESIDNKASLIEMFRKHPNWNEEKLMISFNADYDRRTDTDAIYTFFRWLWHNTPINTITTQIGLFSRCLYDEVVNIGYDNILSEDVEGHIGKINALKEEFRFRPGMKTSRVINKICTSYGWDKLPENIYIDKYGVERNKYDAKFAKYADALNPMKITRHTCISVNPIDFLLMSNGNSWKSCHYIGQDVRHAGCYSSGTISYALDNHSFIFYTISADYDGDKIETEQKILRQIFGYNDSQLLQSRLYPQENDSGADQTYENIRNIIQTVITKCKGIPNRWVKKAVSVRNVYHGDGATCYPDWNYNSKCNVSVLKDFADSEDIFGRIVMGAEPRCIKCGELHTYSGNINHCAGIATCKNCGCAIKYEDDIRWVDGHAYCENCVEWCCRCNEYHLLYNCTWIDNEDIYVCDDCRDEYYSYCEACNEWYRDSKMRTVDDHDICKYCFEDMCSYCEECSEPFFTDDLEEIDGCYYCHECAEKVRAKMEEEETA